MSATLPPRVLFGAAYYHEYQPYERLERDLDLMADAGFSVIRVGESVWSTWEPRDGVFDLEWLAPVLDGAHERGIAVILGTPTYAFPRGCAASTPSSRHTGPPVCRSRTATGRTPISRTRRSCITPSGSFAGSSAATPTTRRSSATRSTTSRGWSCCTTQASTTASSSTCASATATSRWSMRAGG